MRRTRSLPQKYRENNGNVTTLWQQRRSGLDRLIACPEGRAPYADPLLPGERVEVA